MVNGGVTDEVRHRQGDIQMTTIEDQFAGLCNTFSVAASNHTRNNFFCGQKARLRTRSVLHPPSAPFTTSQKSGDVGGWPWGRA